ncbi:PKD domain-containing protein [Methanosarcina barkeri]|uniref:PKD domain-containing protein n=1 Tax=Methanosarcina barkeri TaxID=2208 RepID=UPI001FB3853D|nr:PKD domain-containing protein [Methanosarcina barkeri]
MDKSTGNPTDWYWEFGDGATSTKRDPVHTYQDPGSYTVTLTATNDAGSDEKIKASYIVVKESATNTESTVNTAEKNGCQVFCIFKRIHKGYRIHNEYSGKKRLPSLLHLQKNPQRIQK